MNTYVHSALINPDFVHHNGKLGGGGTRPGATPSGDARGSTAYTAGGQKVGPSSPVQRILAANRAAAGRSVPGRTAPAATGGGFPVKTVAIVGGGVVALGLASFFVIRFLRR